MLDLVVGVYEGIDNIPKMMGSPVRQRGTVDSFSSGVKEGSKGLFFGWWDGITGLVTEPIHGAQKEGPVGIIKGMARSCAWRVNVYRTLLISDVNVNARPAAGMSSPWPCLHQFAALIAGITGFIALPIQGAFLAARRNLAGAPQLILQGPREQLSRNAAARMSKDDKEGVLKSWEEVKAGTQKRKKVMEKRAQRFLDGDIEALDEDVLQPQEA